MRTRVIKNSDIEACPDGRIDAEHYVGLEEGCRCTDPAVDPFKKVVRIGTSGVRNLRCSTYCKVEWDGTRLSISGVEGPLRNGNALGSCGQIDRTIREGLDTLDPAPGWDRDLIVRLLDAWASWHLNDMRAACEHQRRDGRTYDKDRGHVCEECDPPYQIGTAWLREEVPGDVLRFLRSLPETDRTPAWA